jgi:RNA polymerase sigma-70 factor, ECF subfamily
MGRRKPASKGPRKRLPKTLPRATAVGVPGEAGGGVDERGLVVAAQNDPTKFDALYELHFERVYGFVSSRARDRATAEDVTSAVFHKALENLPKYEWRGVPFAAWLLRIAANAIADQAKHARRESALDDDPREGNATANLQGSEMRAEELRAIEHRARLFRLIGKLPEVQKQVIFERFVEQRSIAEIAERLGKTAGAIKQLQLRAVQRLRAQMEGGHG